MALWTNTSIHIKLIIFSVIYILVSFGYNSVIADRLNRKINVIEMNNIRLEEKLKYVDNELNSIMNKFEYLQKQSIIIQDKLKHDIDKVGEIVPDEVKNDTDIANAFNFLLQSGNVNDKRK